MPKYKFEITSFIEVFVEADNEIEARFDIIDHIWRYADDLCTESNISLGEEIQEQIELLKSK